jgi:two-component system, NtrC family, nitrogen regulation sensor histidine kinase GlnL
VPASRPVRHTGAAEHFGWPDVLASLSDGVLILDANGMVDDCNPAAELLTGISASQVIGREVSRAFGTRATNGWMIELVEATLREGVTHRRSEERLWSAGRDIVVGAACAPVLDPSGVLRGAVLVLHDLTLHRAIEAASRQAERLAALDGVAAGLAHEIRNPLGGIKGAAQLLRTGLSDPEQLRCTDLIIREVERLAGLVDQLRDLGSPPPLAVQSLNIHRILRDVLDLEQQAPEWGTIAIVAEFDPSLPPVAGDPALLHQALLNLVKNAVEALDGRGTITIATRMDAGHRVRRDGGRTRYLAVTVADSGPGIPEAHLSRIFAPFFSTKSRGSGLGLALSQRIVTQHGGTLVYDAPPSGGARFRITLPVSDTHDSRDD